jgi:TRAP-type C4-dicarboxylate transport system permease small subunit
MDILSDKLSRFGRAVEDALLVGMLAVMVMLAGLQILTRNLLGEGLVWSDQLLRILVLWVGLLGALAASRDNNHIVIDLVPKLLPPRTKRAIEVLVFAFTSAVSALVAWHAARFVIEEYGYSQPLLGPVPGWVFQTIIPLGFALIAWRYAVYTVVATHATLFGPIPPQGHRPSGHAPDRHGEGGAP